MRIEDGLGNFSSSTSLPLSTLSSPFVPEHTLPVLETLEEDSSPAEEKGKCVGSKFSLIPLVCIRLPFFDFVAYFNV